MLENVTTPPENQMMQRLVVRLRGNRDRWYQRGKRDGMEWAADRAAMNELEYLDENWSDDVITDGDELEEIMNEAHDEGCPSLNAQELLQQWIEKDRNDGAGVCDPNVEWRAYLLGWFHGARDLWRKSKSSL